MTSFSYHKYKQKKFKFVCQHFGQTKSSIWVKIDLDSMVRWRGLDKINVYRVLFYIYFMTIRLHVCDLWNTTKLKKLKK